jgi:uncharacterized protein YidB (DUF937 family)
MGLLDILNGMQNGPRGQSQPGAGGSGGMSPMTMALLGLLAYKAVKTLSGSQAAPGQPTPLPPGAANPGGPGGLSDVLGGLLGGGASRPAPGGLGNILGGAAAGTVLSNGLGSLIRDLQNSGHGQAAQSWIGTGPNQEIAPDNLANALGADTLNALSKQTGLQRDDLLSGLSQYLPGLVDQMTPNGKLPTAEEASRMV